MKALIIAAGNGTRMQPVTRGRHKSLMPLLGLKIIERVLLGAKAAGISEFVIVTGYKGDVFRARVGDGSKYGVSITYVQNDDWEKANGISALKAKAHFRDNFVLLMSDHVFSVKILIKIQRLKLKAGESVLAIDRNMDSALDIADTTKAIVKNGNVHSLNKNLESYNAFDTGMFVCSPYIFEALKRSVSRGKNSLSDAMRILASEGRLRAFDIGGAFWSDCDTYADIKFAEKKLLKSLTKPLDGAVSKAINRRVSTFLTRFLVLTAVTPNMISYGIVLLGLLTFFLLSKGVYPWIFIGGLLIQLMSILDGCDGEVARLKFIGSAWGGYLDANLDKYVDAFSVAGMAYGYLAVSGNLFVIPLAVFVMLTLGLDGYMPNKFKVDTRRKLNFPGPQYLNIKRDSRLLILALGAMINQVFLSFIVLLVFYQYKMIVRMIASKQITDEVQLA